MLLTDNELKDAATDLDRRIEAVLDARKARRIEERKQKAQAARGRQAPEWAINLGMYLAFLMLFALGVGAVLHSPFFVGLGATFMILGVWSVVLCCCCCFGQEIKC